MSVKRDHSTAMGNDERASSPYLGIFEGFKAELDEHHDRRERVIKSSRDITAASKKIIFSLQRVRVVGEPISEAVQASHSQHRTAINSQYRLISKDVQGLNAFRYRTLSGGNQEYIEAISFQHYLETQRLMSYEQALQNLKGLGGTDGPVLLTTEDFLLGIYDMVGELMRFAITTMATAGTLPGLANVSRTGIMATGSVSASRNVLEDLRELRGHLERYDAKDPWISNYIEKKVPAMRQCVEKVENAVYGLIVRGSERPKGWLPDIGSASTQREPGDT